MLSRSRTDVLADAVLDALADSGRRLLGADLVVIAAGTSGQLVVRAAAGPASAHATVTEREPGPDGLLVPVRLSTAGGIVVSPAGARPDGHAIAGSARGCRVLLVQAGGRSDKRIARHLLETASAVLSAEPSAVSGAVRESLHQREEERRRWARELHDDTLQQLGALQVLLTSALPKAGADVPPAGLVDAVRRATELVAGQIGNLRQLITELRPAALDDLGLVPPLQALARRTEQLSGISVRLHVSLRYAAGIVGTRLLPDIELAVYRVVQEALTNVRRHSTATRVTVTVVEDDERVVAEVSDDGQGFDADRATGFGLSGMRERAELAEGTLEVTPSRPDGTGTTVRLVVPARHR
jgi:two-component system, NarL family, sensor histidine kinase DevS